MSRKFLTNLDLTGNQILNVVLQNLASPPGSPSAGRVYFDTIANVIIFHDGSTWINPQDRANHFGTQTASTISDFVSTAEAITLDSFAAPGADVTMAGFKITNLGTPIASSDAATKGYVDSAVSGLEWKDAVSAATTADLGSVTYNNGAGTLTNAGTQAAFAADGHTATLNERILVKNQSDAKQNGIYTVTTVGSGSTNWVLTRAVDANTGALLNDATVFATHGTSNAGTSWVQTTVDAVLGTNNVVFVQFGAGSSYAAGSGITLTGNTFSIAPGAVSNSMLANSSITVTGGTGLGVSGSPVALGGTVTLSNTGVTSNVAGTGISVSGSTGAVTITNTGVTSIVAGTGISISGGTGAVTVSYTGTVLTKYSVLVGDGSSTSIAVTHSLGSRDVQVQLYDASSFAQVENPDVVMTSTSVVTLTFSVAPASNAYKVVIIG
jgi:hypothetical protein